jgi:soluble lytic murein transglycosylase-like protein
MLPLMVSDISLSCINTIAAQYRVPSKLIIAVLNIEQGKKGLAKRNKNGSYDLGEMQINTRWWPMLYQYNITSNDVLYKPCTNLRVGVWILAKAISESNNLLDGVGNYNSHTPIYNHLYTRKIREKYTAMQIGTKLE